MRGAARIGVVAGALACAGVRVVAQEAGADWTVMGGEPGNTHYSALKQINRANVAKLEVAWSFDTGEGGGLETTPLVVGGVLYGLTPSQKVIALHAATGKLLWRFDSGVAGTGPNRGMTYWTDGKEQRLLVGVMNFVYALDPARGQVIRSFGKEGRIDLREGLGREPGMQSVALTSPGVVYRDLLIVGGREPETLPAPPGDVRAYDIRSGVLRWTFHTIPRPGEFGYESWPKEAWKTAGAANNWAGMAVDTERGIVYVPTGSAAPDFYGAQRDGDDLFANTLLALDANTGRRIWHFQGVHHDIWDRDFPAPPMLFSLRREGRVIPAVAETTKAGFLYVFDRVTGTPLFPIESRPYPGSTTPGERAAETQPFPLRPEPFARQSVTEEELTRRTPEAHAWAVARFREIRHEGQYVPLSVGLDTLVQPSFEGGGEWGGPAVDPETGILYVNANNYASLGRLAEEKSGSPGRRTYLAQCSVCHGVRRAGSPPEFPSLLGVSSRLTPEQIAGTIHAGMGRMPAMPVAGKALEELLAYLGTDADPMSAREEQGPASPERASQRADPVGARVYARSCAICHGERMEGIVPSFPTLVGVGDRYTDAQLVALIHAGKGRMPGFGKMPTAEMEALLRFLRPAKLEVREEEAGTQYVMTGYRRFNDPDGYPATAPPWGTLNALDTKTGRYLWRLPFGQYPELVAKGMADTGSENYGGPIVTAGGLLFIGATNFDKKFRAYDKATGRLLWETVLPFAGNATPATYEAGGRQFVVIAAGGSSMNPRGRIGGVYVAFALPRP